MSPAGEYCSLQSVHDLTNLKHWILHKSQAYMSRCLSENNRKKFIGKQVEINFMKTLSEYDLSDKAYRECVNSYLIGLDKNKSEIYIQ